MPTLAKLLSVNSSLVALKTQCQKSEEREKKRGEKTHNKISRFFKLVIKYFSVVLNAMLIASKVQI